MATKCLLLNWMRRALDRHGVRMFCTTYRRAACCTCQRPHRASVCSLARLWLRTQALRWWLASAMTSSCVGMRSEIGTQLTRIGLQASRHAQPSRSLHVSQKKRALPQGALSSAATHPDLKRVSTARLAPQGEQTSCGPLQCLLQQEVSAALIPPSRSWPDYAACPHRYRVPRPCGTPAAAAAPRAGWG